MNPTNAPAAILNESSLAAEPARSIWRDAVRRLLRGRVSRICLIVVALYALMGLVSFTSLLDWRIEHHFTESFSPPALSIDLLLGTDIQGRSVFWRLLYGSRVALTITVLASLISLGIGTVLGMIAGFFGGWLDELITWLYTTASAVPWILLTLAMAYALKAYEISELAIVILALGLTDWVGICRLIRGEVIKQRDQDYIVAARAMGLSTGRIIFRHVLPNVFHLVIITFSLSAVSYVQAEVVLTFLGLGISDKPSWGRMIDDAKLELLKGVWWQVVPATIAIGVLCLVLNLLGDALRDALDPRLRGRD